MTKSLHFDLRNQRLNSRKIDPARRSRKTIRGAASGSEPQRFFTNNSSRRSARKSSQRGVAATHRRDHFQPRRPRRPHRSILALDPNESFRSQGNRGASRSVFNDRHRGMDCFVSAFLPAVPAALPLQRDLFSRSLDWPSSFRAKRRHWCRQKLERRPLAQLR